MNICFLIPSMCGGGAERVISILSAEMVRQGHDVSILMTADNTIDYELDDAVHTMLISGRTGHGISGRIRRISAIREYYKQHRDAAYIGMETSTNIFALIAGFGLNMNITVSERYDPAKYEAVRLRDTVYRILGHKFVFQTNDALQYFKERHIGTKTSGRQSASVIPNPVAPDLPKAYPVDSQCDKSFIAIGRLHEQKDYPTLLKAFKIFCEKNTDWDLKIYGKGDDLDHLKTLSEELGISNKVHFMGFSKDIWKNKQKPGIYVLSSHYEGMPNALIEAMAMGLPVITTDCPIGGPAELVDDEVNGLIIPMEDPDALSKAMLRLAEDDTLRDTVSKNAVKIRDKLSIKSICDKWTEKLLES